MFLRIVSLLAIAEVLSSCATRDDDYLLLRRAGGTDHVEFATRTDAQAFYVRQLLADGFGAELLWTYSMAKRFVARTSGDRELPTAIVLGPAVGRVDGVPLRVATAFWQTSLPADTPIVWIDEGRPGREMDDLVAGLGAAIADTVAPDRGFELRAGYLEFLQVVAAEWRPPRPIDDREELRGERVYAQVRGNTAVFDAPAVCLGERPAEIRPADNLVNDPEVIATVLYRLASSDLGRKMAPREVYRPFLIEEPPRGVHPALLLGAFRNFQAKLLAAWRGAITAGRRPRDLIELVDAYADAYPAERTEAIRIFLTTTYGATVQRGGIRADQPLEQVESQLALLTADVLFGRRGLRDGF